MYIHNINYFFKKCGHFVKNDYYVDVISVSMSLFPKNAHYQLFFLELTVQNYSYISYMRGVIISCQCEP